MRSLTVAQIVTRTNILDEPIADWAFKLFSFREAVELFWFASVLTLPDGPGDRSREAKDIWESLFFLAKFPERVGFPSLTAKSIRNGPWQFPEGHMINIRWIFLYFRECFMIQIAGGGYGLVILCDVDTPPRDGDEIWVLFGCPMPMVLRTVCPPSDYKLIGSVVVSGLMQGEACEGLLSDGSVTSDYRGEIPRSIRLV
jgi:hypothetical protein